MKNSQAKTKTVAKSSSKFTEDWIPVKAIENGYILLDNGNKVTGVKIVPKNIFILDYGSQESTIIGLKNMYNTIDFEFWIISADRKVDIAGYFAQLQLLYNQTSDPAIRKLISQDIDKAESFVNNNVTDTEYFILFKEKNNEIITKKIRTIMMGLANCGLNSSQTSNADLRIILDNFLNGGMMSDFGTVLEE